MKTRKAIFLGVTLLLMIPLMLPLGCAKETPTPTEFKTFSKYGFSFEYPKDFPVTETGVLENEANDNSGVVMVGEQNEEVELFGVTFLKIVQFSLEGGIEGAFTGMASEEGIASIEKGELVETTKAGHRMLYQYYTATATTGERAYGIVGGVHCDKSQKVFSLITMNSTISAKHDVLEDFVNYLDSFVCH